MLYIITRDMLLHLVFFLKQANQNTKHKQKKAKYPNLYKTNQHLTFLVHSSFIMPITRASYKRECVPCAAIL